MKSDHTSHPMKCNICKSEINKESTEIEFSEFSKTINKIGIKEKWIGTYCKDCTLRIEEAITEIKYDFEDI